MSRRYTNGYSPQHPIRDALTLFCDGKPPTFIHGYDFTNLTDAQATEAQDWVNTHLKPAISWSTGIGIMDACDLIVGEAVGNANIPPETERSKREGKTAKHKLDWCENCQLYHFDDPK